ASLVRPWLRFHIPLIEPDWRIARIRHSDKISRLHPRRATTKLGQAHEAEVLVKSAGADEAAPLLRQTLCLKHINRRNRIAAYLSSPDTRLRVIRRGQRFGPNPDCELFDDLV